MCEIFLSADCLFSFRCAFKYSCSQVAVPLIFLPYRRVSFSGLASLRALIFASFQGVFFDRKQAASGTATGCSVLGKRVIGTDHTFVNRVLLSMEYEAFLSLLSITATASTFGLFLCGLQICARIQQRGTTDGTSGERNFEMIFGLCQM